uniref:14-3-3 domain-containing protein n=1 Tax=Strombidinopsis acuminata TaxID=141414 RepID=A0A7S3T4B8_9SPIT|mmetsp:Transcript_41681/g.107909  ORF Transcript_41681/g.107909 Transcript_41681/m.107909 type:complete len:233 (-) Transcript_41681:41-739(-)
MEDKSIILARVAERAERYDEMADFMKDRVEKGTPLNPEERDMFSAAFKNALTERRHAVRVAVGVSQQEEHDGHSERAALANGYRSKVETELQGICNKALGLLKSVLVPTASPGEAKTFYLKMQGDYHRYLAEFAGGDARSRAAEDAKLAYTTGVTEAMALSPVHPVRLGLALNFSVFQHEVLQDTASAVETAKNALEGAANELANVPEESRNDAILTMQLLQDNLSLWEPEA